MKEPSKNKKLTHFQFQIVFGTLLLFLWYSLKEPIAILENNQTGSLNMASEHLALFLLSYISLILGVGLTMIAIANLIGHFKRSN